MSTSHLGIVYLHGFASGPQSGKAQFFRAKFEERGVPFVIPQLDEGDFRGLTISGQLRVIDEAVKQLSARISVTDALASARIMMMGSSLGGYLAALYASRHLNSYASRNPDIERLVLMAPAFEFPSRWRRRFAADLAEWRATGEKPFFHYAFGEERPLGYGFVDDALQYDDAPDFRQPALIFHGTQDDVVPAEVSEKFVRGHAGARLRLLESGHELTDVRDTMWKEVEPFLLGASKSGSESG